MLLEQVYLLYKIPNTNKGITLIALVITIIVMLILVAVTISMAVNGGLFDYAGKAASETNGAIANEQQLANLEENLTVDELIDKYTGNGPVDLSEINVGDYISNYPVEYQNVATQAYIGDGMQEVKADEKFTGWRVLSKETDNEGNIECIKLVSTGVPLCYCMPSEASSYDIEILTTNFLTTALFENGFTGWGFTQMPGTLDDTFENDFTEHVQALTYEDLLSLTGEVDLYDISVAGTSYDDLVAIPIEDSSYFIEICLASRSTDFGGFWTVGSIGTVVPSYGQISNAGVRPVVTLKPEVKFKPAATKINDTTTWEISI